MKFTASDNQGSAKVNQKQPPNPLTQPDGKRSRKRWIGTINQYLDSGQLQAKLKINVNQENTAWYIIPQTTPKFCC